MNNRLSVTILGSGTCLPSLRRSACSVLMETGDVKAVFDCGPGTMGRLLQAGVTVFEVTHLFLSHFHPDHTGEMPSLVFANKYAPAPPRTSPLVLAGGRGLCDFYNGLKSVYGNWIDLGPDLMILKEFSTQGRDDYQSGKFKLVTRPVAHRPESIAFRVSVDNTTVVYSGDTDVSPGLVELSRGADLLICESAWPDGLKKEGHLTPSLAGAIAREAGVQRLILTHLYPECDKVDIRRQCAAAYGGEIIVARDLMRIEW
jgi:ribonuclease BN (tRNA processing enzyme)